MLDNFTVDVITLLYMALVAVLTAGASRLARPVPGLRLLAGGLSAICVGSVFELTLVVWYGPRAYLLCSMLNFTGVALIVQSAHAFRGVSPVPLRYFAWLFSLTAIPYCYFMFVSDNVDFRSALTSAAHGIMLAEASICLMRGIPASMRSVNIPIGLCAACVAATRLLGSVLTVESVRHAIPIPVSRVDLANSLGSSMFVTALAFGMVVAALQKLREESARQAQFDVLTGLPNRRRIMEHLLQLEKKSRRLGQRVSILYLDLNDFKAVNDRLGHDAGDRVLGDVSAGIREILPPGQFFGRIGGDEFIVVIEAGRSELNAVAGQIAGVVARIADSRGLHLGVSCGLAVFPDDGATVHDVLREADFRMYAEKQRRRLKQHAGA